MEDNEGYYIYESIIKAEPNKFYKYYKVEYKQRELKELIQYNYHIVNHCKNLLQDIKTLINYLNPTYYTKIEIIIEGTDFLESLRGDEIPTYLTPDNGINWSETPVVILLDYTETMYLVIRNYIKLIKSGEKKIQIRDLNSPPRNNYYAEYPNLSYLFTDILFNSRKKFATVTEVYRAFELSINKLIKSAEDLLKKYSIILKTYERVNQEQIDLEQMSILIPKNSFKYITKRGIYGGIKKKRKI